MTELREQAQCRPRRARRRRRRVPRRPVRGDRGARRGAAAGARRAAHRVGQERGLLRRHRAAPRPGRGPDAARLAAARRSCATRSTRASAAACARAASRATTPTSGSEIVDALERDEIDLLLVSPERFANRRFRDDVLPLVASRVGLLVIDEVHCISDWGHDFRPDYRRIAGVLDLLPAGVPVLCTTATANDRVVADIVDQLGDDLLRAPRPARPREPRARRRRTCPSPAERLAWLAESVPDAPRHRASSTRSPSRTRAASPTGCAATASTRARTSATRPPRPRSRSSAQLLAQRAQVRRRDLGARHGLRQARPRVRRPLPVAGLGDRLLPAGRAGRARDRPGVRRSRSPGARTARSRTASSAPRSRTREQAEQVVGAARGAGRLGEARRASSAT